MNHREKIIRDNLDVIELRKHLLTVEEKEFYDNVKNLPAKYFTTKRFNWLNEIAYRLRP